MTERLKNAGQYLRSWSQTIAIIVAILAAVWGYSLTNERRISTLEQIVKNHKERLDQGDEIRRLSAENQAKLIELTAQMGQVLDRHKIEDEQKFKKLGVK